MAGRRERVRGWTAGVLGEDRPPTGGTGVPVPNLTGRPRLGRGPVGDTCGADRAEAQEGKRLAQPRCWPGALGPDRRPTAGCLS
ncbi:hypothetical protein GCM10022245_50670 [Streptomyces mayteni]